MAAMDQACREVMSNVEGAVACGMVELPSLQLLGFHAVRRTPALEEAVVAAAVTLLFRGAARATPATSAPAALEAHVASENGYHFAKVLEDGKTAVVVVASRSANVGMGSAQLRAVLPKVDPERS